VSYLEIGACMPFMVGFRFVIDQTFVLAVKEKFEVQPGDDEIMIETKSIRQNCYMLFMGQCVSTEYCFTKLYDHTNTKNNLMVTFVTAVLEKIGLKLEATKRRPRASLKERCTEYTVLPPRQIFYTALCLKQNSRARLVELFPILLHTNNVSAFDKVWIHECIDEFDKACICHNKNPTLSSDCSRNRLNIQQQLGVIDSRLQEERIIHNASKLYEPVLPAFSRHQNREKENTISDSDNSVVNFPKKNDSGSDNKFSDEEDMISVDKMSYNEQMALANSNI
jgi:hypothetical protein